MPYINMVPAVDASDVSVDVSMSDAQVLDDHDDTYELKWLDGTNKENEGKVLSKNIFKHNFDSRSDSELISPSGNRNRYRDSPSWRSETKSLRSFSNNVPDPFVSEKRDVSNDMKSMGIASPQAENEPSKPFFHPREDRIGLQLSVDTAQAMLPPNACVFVAK